MDYLRIRRLGVRVPPSALHILAGQNPQRLEHDRVLERSDSHAKSPAREKPQIFSQDYIDTSQLRNELTLSHTHPPTPPAKTI